MTLGLRACARALGISHPRLKALVDESRVPRNPDGSFDPEAVLAEFRRGTDGQKSKLIVSLERFLATMPKDAAPKIEALPEPVTTPVPTPEPKMPKLELEPPLSENRPASATMPPELQSLGMRAKQPESGDGSETLTDVRIRREKVRLEVDQMTLVDLKQNRLIPTDYVRHAHGDMVITLKTRLLAMGSELAQEVAVLSDAAACKALIDGYVYEALAELSKWEPPAQADHPQAA